MKPFHFNQLQIKLVFLGILLKRFVYTYYNLERNLKYLTTLKASL